MAGSFLEKLKTLMSVADEDPEFGELLEGALTTPQVQTPGMAVHNPAAARLTEAQPVNVVNQHSPEPAQPVTTVVSVEDSAEYKALQARIAEYEAKELEARIERRGREAEAWAKGIVLAGQALPAEQAILAQLHLILAQDDDDYGPIHDTLSRIDLLQSLTDARPARDHTTETVPVVTEGTELRVLENLTVSHVEEDGDLDEEGKRRLLSMTPVGRLALEKKQKAQ